MYLHYLANATSEKYHMTLLLYPDFKKSVYKPTSEDALEFSSEGNYVRISRNFYTISCFSDKPLRVENEKIYAFSNANWFLKILPNQEYQILATPKTFQIFTSLGAKFDMEANLLLAKAKKEYFKEKYLLRLYLYEASMNRLEIISSPPFKTNMFFVHRNFSVPSTNSFILGLIKKTIGAKTGDIIGLVEPVHIIPITETEISGSHDNIQLYKKAAQIVIEFTHKYPEHKLTKQIWKAVQKKDFKTLQEISFNLLDE